MSLEKARVTQVNLGGKVVEGILLPSSEFGITAQQTTALFNLAPDHAVRDIKRLLGNNSSLAQTKVSETHKSPLERYLTLPQLEQVVFELALKGNAEAIAFTRSLVGLSLTQLWSDAFGIKFETEARTQYLANRDEHRKEFHTRLTPYWKEDGCQGKEYQNRVVEFKRICHLPEYISVDEYSSDLLRVLNAKEIEYCTFRRAGLSHEKTIQMM